MKLSTCAKLNLTLDVLGRRSDGYHDMRMIMQSVDLCDTVDVRFDESGDAFTECGGICTDDNLASKAVRAYSEASGIKIGANIKIDKHIPICGGLGGGSADAAAVLTALEMTFGALGRQHLMEVALSLGADVPFAMDGGTALAAGVGEKLKPLRTLPDCSIVLASAGVKDSTGKMFGKLDAVDGKIHPDTDAAVAAIDCGDLVGASGLFCNSFAPLWKGDVPDKIRAIMTDSGAMCCSLSGAGPTMFGIFDDEHRARACCDLLKEFTKSNLCHPTRKSVNVIQK